MNGYTSAGTIARIQNEDAFNMAASFVSLVEEAAYGLLGRGSRLSDIPNPVDHLFWHSQRNRARLRGGKGKFLADHASVSLERASPGVPLLAKALQDPLRA